MDIEQNTLPADIWKAEPLLCDELVRRAESLLHELEKRKVDSWDTLEKREPDTAARLWEQLRRSRILDNLEMLQRFEKTYDGMLSPKEYATDFYNKMLFRVYDCFTRAIEGDSKSIFHLSEHYQRGDEVSEDLYFSFRLLRLVAEQGYEHAYPTLGKFYAFGIGTQKNLEEAVRWFLKIDNQDDVDILAIMAHCYHFGIGVPKDEAKSYDLWVMAALRGHSNAFRFLETAANAGHAEGQYYLGLSYQNGIGTPADIKQALHWFHKAAEQNHVHAQCRIGILYNEGEYGIERDPEIAVQWFRLAATQNDTAAQSRLADCLFSGDGVEQNIVEAAKILKTLAQESPEYPKGEPMSQYRLGTLLTNEEYKYSGYNPKEGVKWLRKSAEQNYVYAQTALGVFYRDGFEDIVKQNLKEARLWFNKAAKQGDCVAQYALGEFFYNGSGVPENRKDAVKWYKQASSHGLYRRSTNSPCERSQVDNSVIPNSNMFIVAAASFDSNSRNSCLPQPQASFKSLNISSIPKRTA